MNLELVIWLPHLEQCESKKIFPGWSSRIFPCPGSHWFRGCLYASHSALVSDWPVLRCHFLVAKTLLFAEISHHLLRLYVSSRTSSAACLKQYEPPKDLRRFLTAPKTACGSLVARAGPSVATAPPAVLWGPAFYPRLKPGTFISSGQKERFHSICLGIHVQGPPSRYF